MAKIQKNSILQGIRGSVGDIVIREMRDDSIRVSVKPVKKQYTFNQEQKGYQDRIRLAVAYAKEARTDLVYTGLAGETGRSAHHLALSDGLTPPVIHTIERRDGRVLVTASDDVMVAKVRVSILDEEGNLLEGGDGTDAGALWLVYPVTLPLRGALTVFASELPGHITQACKTKILPVE